MNETQNKLKIKSAMADAVEFFGTAWAMAQKLEISVETVRKWKSADIRIPFFKAYLIDELTNGKVKIADLIPTHPVQRIDNKK